MKRHIPNAITTLNLLAGCVGISYAFKADFEIAFYCLLACGFFDFIDGLSARLLHVQSTIGKELDSLADVISFGFLPGTVLYTLLQESGLPTPYAYLGYLLTAFSAIRLAKFNTDTRQSTDFIGVNTPMSSFVTISLPFIAQQFPAIILNAYLLLGYTFLSCFLLLAEWRLFSMKATDLSWASNKYKYTFILVSLALLITLGFLAMPFVLVAYIAFSKWHFSGTSQ